MAMHSRRGEPHKPVNRPKPMTTEEYTKILGAIGWTDIEMRKRLGIRRPIGKQPIPPTKFTLQQTRCCRFLALNTEFRKTIERAVLSFPELEITSVRPKK